MLKESFLKYLRYEKNYSEKTILSYGTDLSAFEAYFKAMDEALDYTTVDTDVIRDWVLSLMDEGYTASSVNRKLSSLRSFYRYLLRVEAISVDPTRKVQGPKKKKPLPVFVKEADMDRLLDEEPGDSFESIRDKTIVAVFYETGIRESELIGLKDGDVDFSASQVKVTGKRDKQRIIPFGEELKGKLQAYLSAREMCCRSADCEAFFIRKDGRQMSAGLVYSLVKRELSKVVTLKKRSPHVLRHSFATAMLNNEAGLETVKELLGHESLATTEIYTHTTFEELKKVYEQAHPRA